MSERGRAGAAGLHRARRLWQKDCNVETPVRRSEIPHISIIRDVGDLRVRIDKWLWAARFFKTRTLAADAVDLGRVRVNGERIKPAREARIGDRLELQVGETRIEFFVRALSAQRGPAPIAQQLYEETETSVARRGRRRDLHRYGAEPARSLKGRPTKREGRALRSVRESIQDDD